MHTLSTILIPARVVLPKKFNVNEQSAHTSHPLSHGSSCALTLAPTRSKSASVCRRPGWTNCLFGSAEQHDTVEMRMYCQYKQIMHYIKMRIRWILSRKGSFCSLKTQLYMTLAPMQSKSASVCRRPGWTNCLLGSAEQHNAVEMRTH